MKALLAIAKELIGLFIDDGSLALTIAAVVIGATLLAVADAPALVTGTVLLVGCLAGLIENVLRTSRKHRSPPEGRPT
jgi:hypothetical protein